MSIQNYVSELDSLNKELTRLNKHIRDIRKQKKIVVDKITSYLERTGKNGIRYDGKIISLDNNNSRNKKTLTNKKEDCRGVLEKYGIRNSDKIVEEILESQRGDITSVSKLKINKK